MSYSTATSGSAATQVEPGWQIYVDPRYGYSIQYPEDWYVFPTLEKGMGTLAQFYSYDRDRYPAREMPFSDGEVKIEIVVLDPPEHLTPVKWITTQATDLPIRGKIETQGKVMIDNVEATKTVWSDEPYSSTIIMVPYQDVLLQIIVMPANAESTPLLDTMLNSFQWKQE